MRFPKLTPLQSRFAASFFASLVILIIYYVLSNPHFAYAIELDSIHNRDHNHHRLLDDLIIERSFSGGDQGVTKSELGDEEWADGELRKRQDGIATLQNNVPADDTIKVGMPKQYVFQNSTIFGKAGERGLGFPTPMFISSNDQTDLGSGLAQVASSQATDWMLQQNQEGSQSVYVSITTCSQPPSNAGFIPPQLTLYIGTSPNPGPNSHMSLITLKEGYGSAVLTGNGDMYMTVYAPDLLSPLAGEWSYQLAASIDGFYHSYSDNQSLLLLDTDSNSALFVSSNLTDQGPGNSSFGEWMNMWPPPLTLFAHNGNDSSIEGLRFSYCGLQNYAQIQPNATGSGRLNMSMTERSVGAWNSGPEPKQQFYLNALDKSSGYYGIMAMNGNSSHSGAGVVNGGGQVWRYMQFTTKSGMSSRSSPSRISSINSLADGNCQLLFNLSTCPNLAHAVPSSPAFELDTPSLMSLYDSAAAALLQNFTYSLAQIPCNTTQTAQYSLARNCADCASAYRNWLCAVTIPRCDDFSSGSIYGQPRNVNPLSKFVTGNRLNDFAPPGQNDSIPSAILFDTSYMPMPSAPAQFPFLNQSLAAALSSNQSRNALAGCGTDLDAAQPPVPLDPTTPDPTTSCGIDADIRPGPYTEILPCDEYCNELVRACPASFGFACPARGRGLERSYGRLNADGTASGPGGALMCSFDGAIVNGSAGVASAAERGVAMGKRRVVLGVLASGMVMRGLGVW